MSDPFMPIDVRQINTGQNDTGTERTSSSSDSVPEENKSQSVTTGKQHDSLELSDKAQLVQSLISDLSTASEVNQSRVEQIKSSIASGEYSVSADKITAKMLDLELGLRKLG